MAVSLSPSLFLSNTHNLFPAKTNHRQKNCTFKFRASSSTKSKSGQKQSQKFAEEDAFPSSLPLHTKNPHAIYDDIQRFARQDKLKECFTILDYTDKQGIPINATTFSSLLKACVRSKSLSQGKLVHSHIRINNLENNDFIRTKLVNMYTACGSIEYADKVFDEMPSKSVFAWNALLRGNVIMGRKQYLQLLSTFSEMRELGVDLNMYSFSCLIKSLGGANAFSQGLKAHALLIKYGFGDSDMLCTSLIDMYFKCGKVNLACRVFEEIRERDVVVWGTMIAGFAHNKLQREALEYTRQLIIEGFPTNSVILTTILPVIGELGTSKIGKEIHAYVVKNTHYLKQVFIQSGLIDMYCKCGDMGSGRRVFYGSKERNVVSWTALLSGYVSCDKLDQALRSIIWMQQEGFKPDAVTIATVLPVCGELRALKQGKEIHGYALKNWLLPNSSIVTCLMMMYSKCKKMEYSSKLFNGLEHLNVIAWTAMIEVYIKNGDLYDALSVFRSMQLSKHRPDAITTSRMVSVCGKLGIVKFAKEIHGYVLRKDFMKVPFVSAELVKMYGACGSSHKSKLVFDAISIKGPMTWTAIIEAYGRNEMYQEAINLFDLMINGGFTPNHFTFSVVLSICEQATFVQEARRIFNLMIKRYKIKASEEQYSTIIELLIHSGHVEEAQKFIQMRSALAY